MIDKVVLHRVRKDEIHVRVVWRGGATTSAGVEVHVGTFSHMKRVKELEAMTFNLKKTCACGGTLKSRAIELQGDVCDRVMSELEKLGYKPVRAGG